MLVFGMNPPFSFPKFLETCRDLIPESDFQVIEDTGSMDFKEPGSVTLKKWFSFEVALRNELVKIRASRKHIDGQKYLRHDGHVFAEPAVVHLALSAHRSPSPLDGEKLLDQARWQALDELALGHYFDLDVLVVYALKLLILERWQRINSGDKGQLLDEAVESRA